MQLGGAVVSIRFNILTNFGFDHTGNQPKPRDRILPFPLMPGLVLVTFHPLSKAKETVFNSNIKYFYNFLWYFWEM
jgi:hypothetical protein